MRNYDLINGLSPKLNAFDLSHNHYHTMDFGRIHVVGWYECVPGDIYDLDFQALIRVQPMIAPIMNNITCELHSFFVPTRLLWKDFEKFITTVNGDVIPPETFEGSPPVWGQNDSDGSISDINTDSMELWDCFGFSRKFDKKAPKEARPLDYLRRAYLFIYNEWFRDENLQEPVDYYNSKDVQTLFYRAWPKDYFTSAFYDRQKGISPSIPITGIGNVVFDPSSKGYTYQSANLGSKVILNNSTDGVFPSFGYDLDDPSPYTAQILNSQNPGSHTFTNRLGIQFTPTTQVDLAAIIANGGSLNNQYIGVLGNSDTPTATVDSFSKWLSDTNSFNFDNVGTFNAADMRDMFAIQRKFEGLMRGGSRYIEFLQFNHGTSPSDSRLQIPERIGGAKFNIQISEVLQTGESTDTSVQGNMSGHGFSVTENTLGNYKAEEFGYIIVVATIMPPAIYKDRVPREMYRKSQLEQFSPYFVNLSYQAIYERELYAVGNTDNVTGDEKIFGYQGRYDEMREKMSYVTGDFYDKLAYYLNSRTFENAPALNDDFIKCRPNSDIFAVTDEPPFLCNFYWNTKALRPIPLISEPGLLDHVYGGI